MRLDVALPVLLTLMIAAWATWPTGDGLMPVMMPSWILRTLDGMIFALIVWVMYLIWVVWS